MEKSLPDEFEKIVKDDIENHVFPNFETVLLNHYEHLRIAYKPKDEVTFLFAYLVGNLEASYHKLFIDHYGLERYSDQEYFEIHRLITAYREQIMTKVQEYLKLNS